MTCSPRVRVRVVFIAATASSLFGPFTTRASASAGCTASSSGTAFTYTAEFRKILVNQAFTVGEKFSISFATYANNGGPATKTINVGQGDNSGNANSGGFASFSLSAAPAAFGPFTVPAGGITRLSMSIASGQGTMNATGTITCYLPPTVTVISPTSGGVGGGTAVTITGTNFIGATAVTLGGTAATSVAVVNATSITATTAAHAAGVVDVVVTTPGGTGTGSSLYTFVASSPPVTPTPPPTPTGPPPTVSNIADQTIPQNGSVTVPFTVSGAIIAAALRVTVSSSNTTMLPLSPATLNATCDSNGSCSLRIAPADGRGGTAIVTLTVTDGTLSASTSFTVRVTVIRPSAPPTLLANVVGSGVVLTWAEPDTGTPAAYAVAWGTSANETNLPVQLVPGTVGRLEFSSLPIGTFYFRVYAVGAGDLSPASPPHSATVTTGGAPAPPNALQAVGSSGGISSSWRSPQFGAPPTLYEIHVGSGLELSDIASATTAATSLDASASPGTYWVRVRAASGGAVGAWSSSVQIPIGMGGSCASAPPTPTLLPVTSTSGQAVLTWWAGGGDIADHYEVQLAPAAGLAPVGTFATRGPGTSLVWAQTGTFAARGRRRQRVRFEYALQ